ncbi:hypothetical protein EDB89DRAFT_2071075 [Lactarius sanguifluus]|nr:hypothetical protein EDB89DRAFT_2071075 [Lactarius sanguifluus]
MHRVRWPRRTARRKAERNMMFGLFGGIQAEATLRELDPRRVEQRRGDSDVDWGGSTSGVGEVEDSDDDDGGMLAHISTGDLEDEARIRLEDADEDEEEDKSGNGNDGEDVDTELELADAVRILAAGGFGELFC